MLSLELSVFGIPQSVVDLQHYVIILGIVGIRRMSIGSRQIEMAARHCMGAGRLAEEMEAGCSIFVGKRKMATV